MMDDYQALNLDLPVDLGNSDVMMVPVSRRVTAVMMLQTAEMVVMNKTVVAQLMAMVCTRLSCY
jgi:hypothetical protein